MNKVFLSGRLTRDVESRNGNNTVLARTGIAVDRVAKAKEVDFFNLVAFGKTAEIMGKYCKKGTKIILEGHLNFSQYDDKNGQKKSSTSVIIDSFEFAESKNQSSNSGGGFTDAPAGGDDYPF